MIVNGVLQPPALCGCHAAATLQLGRVALFWVVSASPDLLFTFINPCNQQKCKQETTIHLLLPAPAALPPAALHAPYILLQ